MLRHDTNVWGSINNMDITGDNYPTGISEGDINRAFGEVRCDWCGGFGHTKYQCEETEHGGDGDED